MFTTRALVRQLFERRCILAPCTFSGIMMLMSLQASATGTITQVASRDALGANDFIDWSQLPQPYQPIPDSVSVTSNNGMSAQVNNLSTAPGALYSEVQGHFWQGNFAPGDFLLEADGSFEITFAQPVSGAGAQMGYDRCNCTFFEHLVLYDAGHNVLASLTATGLESGAGDDSAVFIGAIDTVAEIKSVRFFANNAITDNDAFAINRLSLIAACPSSANVSIGTPCISTPSDGARPRSQFVALSGTGEPGDSLDVLVGGLSVGQVKVDSEGNWEALPYVSLYGSSATVQVQDQTTSNLSNTITVHPSLAAFLPGPSSPPNSLTALLPLRKADIFVTASDTSPQYFLYGPNYTHAALYLGGDSNGTPLIAEAITAAEAGSLIGTAGQVRSIPLDQSLAWTQSQRISAWHPKTALSGATRSAIVTWAQNITSQGLPYWSTGQLVGLPAAANALYLIGQTALAERYLKEIYALTTSTSTFICSTLVWRAYYEGTGHTLDISQPNLMSAQSPSLMATFSQNFINLFLSQAPVGCTVWCGSTLMVPETLVRSGKLSQIF